MKEFWDARYNSSEFIYGIKPNEFFKNNLNKIKKGKILLPGDGEGRNAVYAAKNGWDVTAFDYSVSAKEKALHLAEENQVKINYITTEASAFSNNGKFDNISIIYFHLPPKARLEFHRKLKHFLNVEGKVVLECFSKSQIDNRSGGPKDLNLLYSTKQLEADFDYLNIKLLEEKEIYLEEGEFHNGKASVIRMIAQKY